eukprot:1079001-Amphidinium_carterae.1
MLLLCGSALNHVTNLGLHSSGAGHAQRRAPSVPSDAVSRASAAQLISDAVSHLPFQGELSPMIGYLQDTAVVSSFPSLRQLVNCSGCKSSCASILIFSFPLPLSQSVWHPQSSSKLTGV